MLLNEMGKDPIISDFLVDTKGHCFICLRSSSSHHFIVEKLESAYNISNHSLQYLSRYLKLNKRKVFSGDGPIPSHLLEEVDKSILKVPLCSECSWLNKKTSKLIRQLEKIEIEIRSHIKVVRDKLLEGDATSNGVELVTAHGSDNVEWLGKREVLKALRKDAIEKCDLKLASLEPRLKIKKLSAKDVIVMKKKRKLKANSSSNRTNKGWKKEPELDYGDHDQSNSGINGDEVKMETSTKTDPIPDDDDDYMDNFGNSDDYVDDFGDKGEADISNVNNGQNVPEIKRDDDEEDDIDPTSVEQFNFSSANRFGSPKPTEPRKFSFNPETGKYKCSLCSNEIKSKQNLNRHYQSVHLKVKYKCNLCGMECTDKSSYNRHHKKTHKGVRN